MDMQQRIHTSEGHQPHWLVQCLLVSLTELHHRYNHQTNFIYSPKSTATYYNSGTTTSYVLKVASNKTLLGKGSSGGMYVGCSAGCVTRTN
jgi:hypothetical protein